MYHNIFKFLKLLYIFLIIFIAIPSLCFAQGSVEKTEFGSSPNPVGSGARAIGMGGAFIAVADDATAASWNPGGLIQLELPEISFAGAGFHRTEDNTFGISPESDGAQRISGSNLNYLSAVYPFSIRGYNMIVSLNYQHLYEFNRKWHFSFTPPGSVKRDYEHEQSGSLYALGIAYGIQITPEFSFGVTLNSWDDGLYKNEWEQTTIEKALINGREYENRISDRYSFSGVNANFGFLWNVTGKLTIGGVFKMPFDADLEHEFRFSGTNAPDTVSYTENNTLTMPMSYGIGIAYRFSDAFTASFDIYRTEWDDFILTDAQGNETSPITGKTDADIDPTHQIRLGAEYLMIKSGYVIPLRGGFFYDPAPAEGSPDDFFGFALGSGIAWKWFVFDIAYQFRYGNDVGGSLVTNMDFSQDVKEHTVYSSVILHF